MPYLSKQLLQGWSCWRCADENYRRLSSAFMCAYANFILPGIGVENEAVEGWGLGVGVIYNQIFS